jgi:drug/metabolite transporter (DMT)-like permease
VSRIGAAASRSPPVKSSPFDFVAIAICTLAWGTTWYAVTLQLGVVDPMVSVVYRFALACVLLFLWCAVRREKLAFSGRQHVLAAGLGFFGFTLSYAFTYEAETRVVSAVVAVIFASLAFVNLVTFRAVLGHRTHALSWVASALGAAGVGLLSWGEIAQAHGASRPIVGLALSVLGVVATAIGNVFAHRGEDAGSPVAASTAWATLYGTLFLIAYVVASGRRWSFEPTARYVFSLLYLSTIGSVVAFLLYFRVARSRGYTTASYILALTPILAMAMSTLYEGKTWNALGLGGVVIVFVGQWLLLRK